MKDKILIGTNRANNEGVFFNIVSLIKTRLLICANSGGGKSWLLRRLAELLCKIMPVIIFDWEGEFSTLREKFDFLIIGKGGDAPTDTRSAKLVMLRLLEWRTSAVIDLSELPPEQKHLYVKLACEAAINSPKELWQETAFIFDEAHEVCPENGKGFSLAKSAVLGFPTKGRKRRFLSIFATQRVHKLALDARAEMLNRMIGMTFEPDDIDTAAKIAGISGKEETAKFRKDMRSLPEGNFFTFGRAVSLETILVKVGTVETNHEKFTERGLTTPPPTARIKKFLPQLADLPREAEAQEMSLAESRERIKTLNAELAEAKRANPLPPPVEKIKTVHALSPAERKQATAILSKADLYRIAVERAGKQFEKIETDKDSLLAEVAKLARILEGKLTPTAPRIVNIPNPPAVIKAIRENLHVGLLTSLSPKPPAPPRAPAAAPSGDFQPDKCQRAILAVLSQFPEGCSMQKIALLAIYSMSGGFRNSLSILRQQGCIEGQNGETMRITEKGLLYTMDAQPIPKGADCIRFWQNHPAFSLCERQIVAVLYNNLNHEMSMEEIAAACSPPYQLSGGFRNSLSILRTAGVIVGQNKGHMRINPEMF